MVCVSSIEIPLLFGGIKADKDGLNFQRGINNNGDGVDHNTNFGWGGGNFGIKVLFGLDSDRFSCIQHQSRTILSQVDARSGPRSSLGVGKDGFNWGAGVVVTERPQISRPYRHPRF
ncbi:hypothetical protein OSTOST_15213 [Ostertagia ostertagi]